MKKIAWFTFASILVFSLITQAQNQENKRSNEPPSKQASQSLDNLTNVSLERDIMLENASKTEEVALSIERETIDFNLTIRSSITAGNLTIELFDPSGNKQGNFSVETQSHVEKKEQVKGILQRRFKEPQPGIWRIKISPSSAKGSIKISSYTFQ